MLELIIGGEVLYNEEEETFSTVGGTTLELEHSLVSLSKWESEFEKPFLGAEERSDEEVLSYIKCMIVTRNFPPEVLNILTTKDFEKVSNYLNLKQSATTFNDRANSPKSQEVITSELIYYWMVAFSIPFVCETWNLNRLFALIRICSIKNSDPKKMNSQELAQRNRELNAQRRQELGTKG